MDSDSTRRKWDARYCDTHSGASTVAEVLTQNAHLLPKTGTALDLACGLGGNALFLAGRGLEVHAWDISPVGIAKLSAEAQRRGMNLQAQVRDVVAYPPVPQSFDVIVVSRFLQRSLCPAIAAALKPQGLLFYQTFLQQNTSGEGPRNPHFLLQKGELRGLFTTLEEEVYREEMAAMFVGRRAGLAESAARP